MPIVQIWGLPDDYGEGNTENLYREVVSAAAGIKELGLSERHFTFFFPIDHMKMGLGAEIICFVQGLFVKPERTDEVRKCLAKAIGETIEKHFPNALVECLVRPFDPTGGFWSSEEQ